MAEVGNRRESMLSARESESHGLAGHRRSDLDAMGNDKRRRVVGQAYGPSFARQATLYGIFLAVVAALAFGFIKFAQHADQPPASNPDVAPWSQPGAKQIPPKPLQ